MTQVELFDKILNLTESIVSLKIEYERLKGELQLEKEKNKRLEKQLETTYTKRDVDNAWLEGISLARRELEKQYPQILANSANTCKDKQVTFTCIDKKVTMSVQELIDYYIDNECANTAEECNF